MYLQLNIYVLNIYHLCTYHLISVLTGCWLRYRVFCKKNARRQRHLSGGQKMSNHRQWQCKYWHCCLYVLGLFALFSWLFLFRYKKNFFNHICLECSIFFFLFYFICIIIIIIIANVITVIIIITIIIAIMNIIII